MGVIPEDLSPPPGPDHDQPGRLSFRGLWVCGICRHSFSRSSGHSQALPRTGRLLSLLICVVPVRSAVDRDATMGKGCVTATKYFLFLLNLLFFVSISPLTPVCSPAGDARGPQHLLCVFTALWWCHHGIWTLAAPGQSELHRGPQ